MTIPLLVLPNISGNENISEIWLYSQKQDLKGKKHWQVTSMKLYQFLAITFKFQLNDISFSN